jgi:hypothetical protein
MILSELGERRETSDVNRALRAIRKIVARGRAASASTLQKSGAAPAGRRACRSFNVAENGLAIATGIRRRGRPDAIFRKTIILDYYSELVLLDNIVLDRLHTCRLTNFQTPST